MSYLGNAPESVFTEMKYQDLTGGSGTSFTLNQAVSNPQEIEVFVNNVRQEPSAAYSVSGTTLTMTESVGASEDFYVIFQGMAQGSATHPATQSLEAAAGTFTGDVAIDSDGGFLFDVSDKQLEFGDNYKAVFGAGSDLKIWHDGGKSIIEDSGTGKIQVRTNQFVVNNEDNNENMIKANQNGNVQLFYDQSLKFETTSTGANVTGGIRLGGNNAANELDDYEEGTFTPAYSTASATATAVGRYTKVGRIVTVQIEIRFTQSGTSFGSISGLPFATSTLNYQTVVSKEYYSDGSAFHTYIQVGATATANWRKISNNSITAVNAQQYGFGFSFTYHTA